jgi:hypothetical protein
MTLKCDSAISRRDAPEFCLKLPPSSIGGRRECRAPDAPAALRAKIESTQASHHGHTGNTRHSPRNGVTAYSVLSLVTGLSCHHRFADHPAKLDASVGASGPHGFAVRAPCHSSFDMPASIASRPASVTIASRPSSGTRRRNYGSDLPRKGIGIFLRQALDSTGKSQTLTHHAAM